MIRKSTQHLVLAGFFLALGLLMPFLTAQIPSLGSRLLPMHIPVLLCGCVLGGPTGLLVGLITPLLRSVLFGMPPLFPTAAAMAFELAAYGLFIGMLYKTTRSIYLSLVLAMLGGRAVWGIVSLALYGLAGSSFSWQLFTAGAFVNALPGIILQLILIPGVVIALERAGLIAKVRGA